MQLAILFADVCESTSLYERFGDVTARETIAQCLAIMQQCVQRRGGQVIKTIGDEIMATFPLPDAAADAAGEMHELICARMSTEERRITIRVGFHFGSVLLDNGDVYGDAVNTAARIAAETKSQQILTPAATVARMSQTWKSSTRPVARASLKGKQGKIDVVEIIWRGDDLTRLSETGWERRQMPYANMRLQLSFEATRIQVCEQRPIVTMGRADDNDLVIKHNLISRLHARIEYSKGRFLLVDQSINGTYILTDDGDEHFVRRDSRLIYGSGMIGLGRIPHAGSAPGIAYRGEEWSDNVAGEAGY